MYSSGFFVITLNILVWKHHLITDSKNQYLCIFYDLNFKKKCKIFFYFSLYHFGCHLAAATFEV